MRPYDKHAYDLPMNAANSPTLSFVMHEVARLLRKRFEQRARQLGLTRSQWHAMAHLAQHEGIHQGALADILEIEPITLVRILDRLEERGLIERRRHPKDRRIRLLYLTEAARAPLETMRKLGDLTRGEALAGISQQEREQLLQTLTRMKINLIGACNTPVDDDRALSHG